VLIDESVSKVVTGSRLVKEVGSTMDEVVASVRRVTAIMSEITVATGEQGEGISQVNHAILQMDSVTQQNAALVEEAAATAPASLGWLTPVCFAAKPRCRDWGMKCCFLPANILLRKLR